MQRPKTEAQSARRQVERARRETDIAEEATRAARHGRRKAERGREMAEAAREEAERARQEAEVARRNLQNFLSMVAHDLRGPLTAIQGYAQLLARPNLPVERRERALTTLQTAAQQMDRLIADLSDAARIGTGRFEVKPQPMDLVALARQVVQAQQATTARHDISLEAPSSLVGQWDRNRLTQVLNNLVSNAIKYSPGGGRITVRIRREGEQAVLSVSDQGVGFRPQDLPKLFQPFARAQRKRGAAGAGLGLYISQGIVQAHGGRIWAESPGPGQGATFTVTLPLAQDEASLLSAERGGRTRTGAEPNNF